MNQWQSPRPQHRIPKGGQLILGCGGVAVVLLIAASCGAALERNGSTTAQPEKTVTVTVTATPDKWSVSEHLGSPQTTVTVTVTANPKPRKSKSPKPKPSPTPRKTTTKPAVPKTDPRFGTCSAANDAGYGPYYQGQDPEYSWYIDRDGDGVVCER